MMSEKGDYFGLGILQGGKSLLFNTEKVSCTSLLITDESLANGLCRRNAGSFAAIGFQKSGGERKSCRKKEERCTRPKHGRARVERQRV